MDTECWVFVSGFTQDGNACNPVRRPLQRALGYQETGLASAPTDAESFADAAAQLASLASYHEDEQRLARATFVGYSQGGRLCLQLALDRPAAMAKLVLVSASPGIAEPADEPAEAGFPGAVRSARAIMAVRAPSSMPPVASATRCDEIRLSSISMTRMTVALAGICSVIPSSFSTPRQ